MNPIRWIDNVLNSITMYRLVLYGLGGLALLSIIFSIFGLISFSPLGLVISLVVLLATCFGSNYLFAKLFKASLNIESPLITALILFFLFIPPTSGKEMLVIIGGGVLAMASKYVLAIKRKHLFNPAAISAVILSLLGSGIAIWWVATPILLPFILIIGLAVVKKIRRFALFLVFLVASLIMIANMAEWNIPATWDLMKLVALSYPLFFFGTIMLTEPLTTPPTRKLQIVYGAGVGILFFLQFHIGKLYSTPELALIIGNVFSYIVSPKQRLKLMFEKSQKLSFDIYEFVFRTSEKLSFQAGQYLEWTLPNLFLDSRGNRRYFTIASAPTEGKLRLGVRTFAEGSEFKKRLISLEEGNYIWASQLSGEFVMPVDVSQKLVFIAGGIGITPFRSMIKYLLDKKEKRDIVLIYTCVAADHFVYQDIFKEAENMLGIKVYYVITDGTKVPADWTGLKGFLTAEMISTHVKDYKDRLFYLSGPNVMVKNYSQLLQTVGVERKRIKKDYFPGF